MVKLTQSLILNGILTSNLTLQLIDIVLTLNLTQDLHCCLLNNLSLFYLISTILKLVCLR